MRKCEKARDFNSGSVLSNILYFSLPYLLSYFLQTLYGMADLFIIGQFDGTAATTAVSLGSQVMHMLTVILVGLAMGTTVSIGQAVGARDKKRAGEAIGNTVVLFLGVSVALMVLLTVLVRPIVALISTPEEAVAGTIQYLTICFIGIPFITAYNVISSIFRGLGDSKSPMYFIAIACGVNIVLDYLFMGAFHMGPAGAALGTTLSQTVSVLIAFWAIRRRDTGLTMKKSDLKPRGTAMGQLLRIGLPVAMQDGLIQVSFILITVIANRRGLTDHREPQRFERSSSGGNRGENHQLCVPGALFDAVYSIGSLRPEYRRRRGRAGKEDTALRHLHSYRVWPFYGGSGSVYRKSGGRPVLEGRSRGDAGRLVLPWLYF